MSRDEEIAERSAANLEEFFEHGPGLRWSTRTWVIAKDTAAGMVKCGGLGSMGVGEMWLPATDLTRADPTYAEAPEQTYPGEPFG